MGFSSRTCKYFPRLPDIVFASAQWLKDVSKAFPRSQEPPRAPSAPKGPQGPPRAPQGLQWLPEQLRL